MSTMKKKTPVAGQGNEGNESIAERSVTTAYLSRWGSNTGDTFGTWSGEQLPRSGYIPVLVPFHVAQEMVAYGPQLVELNQGCVEAQSAAVRAEQKKDRRARINNERAVIVKGAEADITYSVELLDALGTDEWTEQLEHDAIEFLEEVLDRDVSTVTPELLAEARHARRRRRDFQLARLEEEL